MRIRTCVLRPLSSLVLAQDEERGKDVCCSAVVVVPSAFPRKVLAARGSTRHTPVYDSNTSSRTHPPERLSVLSTDTCPQSFAFRRNIVDIQFSVLTPRQVICARRSKQLYFFSSLGVRPRTPHVACRRRRPPPPLPRQIWYSQQKKTPRLMGLRALP